LKLLGLERFGLRWVDPTAPLAHLLADGTAVTLENSLEETARQLGPDGDAYQRLLAPVVEHFDSIASMFLGPLRAPRSPVTYVRFGVRALASMESLDRISFRGTRAGALLAGIAAHAMVPLDAPASCAFGLILGAAGHAAGWPIARGGSQAIVDALTRRLTERRGRIVLGHFVERMEDLPRARVVLLDLTPRQVLALLGARLPSGYRRRLERYRYGPGVFKMDWALSEPIPWRDPRAARAATVHLSGSSKDVARSVASTFDGRFAEEPFVLLAQPTLFDPSRAPTGRHTAWAYCHVPHGSPIDASVAIEAHIERHAPGFRDVILARATRSAPAMEAYNPNYVGGDINGGAALLSQLFFRPVPRLDPYRTPLDDMFLCSSATPPGGGVHGMCGYWAARSVLARFGDGPRRPVTAGASAAQGVSRAGAGP
jgi:phytoene dehydrogenase-like protein